MRNLPRIFLSAAAVCVLGCSNTTTDDDDVVGDTVRLRIALLETTAGEAADDVLPVGCAPWATITFGPSEDAGILDGFTLGPPGSCSAETDACGYIEFTVESEGLDPIRRTTILTTTSFELPEDATRLTVSARLIQGKSLEPFLNPDGREVAVRETFELDRACASGLGGMGGGAPSDR